MVDRYVCDDQIGLYATGKLPKCHIFRIKTTYSILTNHTL